MSRDLLRLDPPERSRRPGQTVRPLGPGDRVDAQSSLKVGGAQTLDEGDSLGILVSRLGDAVPADPTERSWRPPKAAGEVRGELTLEQVLDLVGAVAKIPGDAGYVEPILQAGLDGLKP